MADKSDEENLNIFRQTINRKIVQTKLFLLLTQTLLHKDQEIENVELHHHPDMHHKPKKMEKNIFLNFFNDISCCNNGFCREYSRRLRGT